MKTFIALSLAAATTSAFVCLKPPGGDRPPRDTFFELFDTDQDGEISIEEIDSAAAILKKRDADNSGALTPDELPRPPRPPRRGESDQGNGGPAPPPQRDGETGDKRGSRQRPPMDDENSDAVSGTVRFGGGYETNPVDNGRPVALIAAALGVKEQVFRDAFSNVKPSSFGPPSPMRAQANKKALMDALGKYGVTNERLDEVSNYYRYRPEAGELWTVSAAKAMAVIEDGKVTGFDIISPGSGYSSAPNISIVGHPDIHVQATIEFSDQLRTNGRVANLNIIE